jgi:hypothetical protein
MKTRNEILDFLDKEQDEQNLTAYQLHLIVQTLVTFLDDNQLQEVENLFNLFKN